MTSTMTSRATMVLSTTVFAFLCMAGLAALTTIARDCIVQPMPTVYNIRIVASPVSQAVSLVFVPKVCVPSLRKELEKGAAEARQAREQEENAMKAAGRAATAAAKGVDEAESQKKPAVVLPLGFRGSVERIILATVDRLVAIPFIGPYLEGRGPISSSSRRRRSQLSLAERILEYPVTKTPYINHTTGVPQEHVRPPREAFREHVTHIAEHMPSLVAYERTTDRVNVAVSGVVDISTLWDWNTKAIYVDFLLRYATPPAALNEVVFTDAIVRDLRLPWRLRHLQRGQYEDMTAEEHDALNEILTAAAHNVHDAKGVTIDHVAKKIHLANAAKYVVEDFGADALADTDVELVMRYQVMSYSGWAPVRELQLGVDGGPLLMRLQAASPVQTATPSES